MAYSVHRVSKGRRPKGENHPAAVLTEELVKKIRLLNGLGIDCAEISRKMKLPYQAVKGAATHRSWRHV